MGNKLLRVIAIAVALFLWAAVARAMTAGEFFRAASGRPGVNAFAATVQSAHETGFWTSELWSRARNGAGIKATAVWTAAGRPTVTIVSPESVEGTYILRRSVFRKYGSLGSFLDDYGQKIRADYPFSAAQADNFWGYFAGLYRGRWGAWATDHRYFELLAGMAVRLAPELLGDGWRSRMLSAFALALERGTLSGWQIDIITKKLKGAGMP